MKQFRDSDFLLNTKTAERLYHEYAASLPIICGTTNYSFIWGMAGENMTFTYMDPAPVAGLR